MPQLARCAVNWHDSVMRDWTSSSLGERIAFLVAALGKTQNSLGEQCGLDSPTMSRLANKKAVMAGEVESMVKLSDGTGCSFVWISAGRADPFPPSKAAIDAAVARELDARGIDSSGTRKRRAL